MEVEEMKMDIEEYLEAAGFSDSFNRVIADSDDGQIKAIHNEICRVNDDGRY